MITNNTSVEKHSLSCGREIWVKREDLCCPLPGPQFSKIRGVYKHIESRSEKVIGVLDTFHSKAGWAVAYVCKALGRRCVNFYPVYKTDKGLRPQQEKSLSFGAELIGISAGRSAILYHRAKKMLPSGGYMMPNALKLVESVEETAAEVGRTFRGPSDTVGRTPCFVDHMVVPASSGTIAAGVIKGLAKQNWEGTVWIHLGYDRPRKAVRDYLLKTSGGFGAATVEIVNEGYAYKDSVKAECPFPCNPYYDLKTWKWLDKEISKMDGEVMLWNIGA